MAQDWASKSEIYGEFGTLSARLDFIDSLVSDLQTDLGSDPSWAARTAEAIHGHMNIVASALTSISAQNTPVKIAGTTSYHGHNTGFIHTNGRLTYGVGLPTATVTCIVTVSLDASGNNKDFKIHIVTSGSIIHSASDPIIHATSGPDIRNASLVEIGEVNDGDWVEVWIENLTDSTDITVLEMNVVLMGMINPVP